MLVTQAPGMLAPHSLHRTMLEDVPTMRGTPAGVVTVTRLLTPPRTPPPPDFMAEIMTASLKMRTMTPKQKRLLSPAATCRPLVGRDVDGRLCKFSPDRIDRMSSKPGPGGWPRVASFDGLNSSQRGVPPRTMRVGPGPQQSMPHTLNSLSVSGSVSKPEPLASASACALLVLLTQSP